MTPTAKLDETKAEGTLSQIPRWVAPRRDATLEDVAFVSGAALCQLHLLLSGDDVPKDLLRGRLALLAAEAAMVRTGRPERAADLRDAQAFLVPGDSPGPAGEVYQSWHRAIERPLGIKSLGRALPMMEPHDIGAYLDAGQGGPVARAAGVLEAVQRDRPRDPGAALILADAALAQSLGWRHLVPVLGQSLSRSDVTKEGDALRLACHRGLMTSASEAIRIARDLTRKAKALQAVAPKLRAKGSDAAVALVLGQDAVSPAMLTSLRSSRAARRFCDRLVELDVVRELTGRDTFRLYGLA